MALRKFINELMVVSPLLFIAAISVEARTGFDGFTPVEYTPRTQERLKAYVEPVRLVEQALANGASLANPDRVRHIGQTWKNMAHEGVLGPLPPETSDDTTREGIKGQVRRAADELASALQLMGHRSLKAGNASRAAQDALLALEVIHPVRQSDLYSLGMFGVRQDASYKILWKAADLLSEEERQEVLAQLRSMDERSKSITDVVLAAQRATQSPRDKGKIAITKGEFELALKVAHMMDDDPTAQELEQLNSKLGRNVLLENDSTFLPEFRFAISATRNSMRDRAEVVEKLS